MCAYNVMLYILLYIGNNGVLGGWAQWDGVTRYNYVWGLYTADTADKMCHIPMASDRGRCGLQRPLGGHH